MRLLGSNQLEGSEPLKKLLPKKRPLIRLHCVRSQLAGRRPLSLLLLSHSICRFGLSFHEVGRAPVSPLKLQPVCGRVIDVTKTE